MKLEPVKLTSGLNTDISPKAIDTQKNRLIVNPIVDALNARYITSDNGKDFIFESVKGTVKVTNSGLPGAGVNKQIGSFEDTQNNVLVFWLYNSAGNHGVYEYSPETGAITTLIQSSFLNFQDNPLYRITGIGVQGDLRYWTDGYNPQRVINRTIDYSTIASDKPITLIKEHPRIKPSVPTHPDSRTSDATILVNKIVDRNLQFSYQFIFIDNEKSVIGPISDLSYAELQPIDVIDTTSRNTVTVSVDIPSDVLPFIKQVNMLVREGNEGLWGIWAKVTSLSTTISAGYSKYESTTVLGSTVDSVEIPDAETTKLFESIPTVSKALCVHRNRVVVSTDQEGFNVSPSAISISAVEGFESYKSGPTKKTYFKRGGSRSFAIAVFDGRGRSMGVLSKTRIHFSPADDDNNVTDNFETDSQRPYVQLTLSGDLSAYPDAAYFSIVTTEEEYYEQYMQIPVVPFFYRYENPATNSPNGSEILMNGRMYLKGLPSSASQFNRIHLLMPKEAAFIPTEEYLVRLMSKRNVAPFNTAKLEKVTSVLESQFIVVDDFGISNWTPLGSHSSIANPIFVEVFKIKQAPTNIFYEITDRLPLNSGVPSQTSFTIYGDQYYVIDHKFNYPGFQATTSLGSGVIDNTTVKTASIESPTPTFGFKSIAAILNNESSMPSASARMTILDYSKIDWNAGKPFVELNNPMQLDRSNVIRFSNRYLPDSSINGLSSFDSSDEYPLPVDRTPIKKLVPIGNNIIAVHERSISTLYVEQSMIKNTEGGEQLVTTDRFIGYDREAQFKIGSFHAESVESHLGLAFGFDVYKGVVWQYSNEGVSIISNFGKMGDFAAKALQVLQYKTTTKVIGGIDPYHSEYLISFVFPDAQSAWNETWAYNWEKNVWTARYSAVPDGYAKVNNKLVSFKEGELWLHNQSGVYNNFYGVQYQRRLKIAVNPYPGRSKNWMGLHIATNLLSSGSDPEFKVVQCYTESGQETYMKVDDFEKLQGVFYGSILRDINTPGALIDAGKIALRDGDEMLGEYIEIELINDNSTDPCPVQYLNVTYVDSEYTQ